MSYAVSLEGRRSSAGVELFNLDPFRPPEPPPPSDDLGRKVRGLFDRVFSSDDPATLLRPVIFEAGDRMAPWDSHVREPVRSAEPAMKPIPPAIQPATDSDDDWFSGPHVRYKAAGRMENYSRRLENFGTALAVKFAATTTDDQLLGFMDKWGIPTYLTPDGPELSSMPLSSIRRMHWAVGRVLDQHRNGDPAALNVLKRETGWADLRPVLEQRRSQRPTLEFVTTSLLGFMSLEIGTMIASAGKVMRCDHCSRIYVAGSYDGKHRRVSRFCSNNCRVADQRARKRERDLRDRAQAAEGTNGL